MVACPHCDGSGEVALSATLAATLALLRARGDEPNGSDLARVAGCAESAMTNRLMALHAHGLARYRRDGRMKRWTAT